MNEFIKRINELKEAHDMIIKYSLHHMVEPLYKHLNELTENPAFVVICTKHPEILDIPIKSLHVKNRSITYLRDDNMSHLQKVYLRQRGRLRLEPFSDYTV